MNPAPLPRPDTLVEARWIIPVEPAGTVLEGHALALGGERIVGLLPAEEARERYPDATRVSLGEQVILPGLVNLHTHAAMALMRGIADDLPLMRWLQEHIWPAEAKHVAPDFVHDGTLLACAEMLRGGVTCFNDMYFFPEAAARAVLKSGMRAALGMIVIEFPTAYASDPQDYLSKGLATRDAFRDESRLSFCFAPHAPYTVSDKSFTQVLTYADQLGAPVHVHLHETAHELDEALRNGGQRPLARLDRLGLVGPSLIAVHAVHLDPAEIRQLADCGAHVAHCPASNLKLASGIAPVAAMLAAGVNVGLGTDGAASNNRLDLLAEMRLAALLAKGASGDAEALPAHQAIAMATLNGARALGLDASIGSLRPGKQADFIAIDLSALETSPCYDPASQVVYAAGREHVSQVWVAGLRLVEDGRLTALDTADLSARAARWRARLSAAG